MRHVAGRWTQNQKQSLSGAHLCSQALCCAFMSSGPRNPILLEDIFQILEVDPDGKKFDKGIMDLLPAVLHICKLKLLATAAKHIRMRDYLRCCSDSLSLPLPRRPVRDGPDAGPQHRNISHEGDGSSALLEPAEALPY